jgi:hypothetical protein
MAIKNLHALLNDMKDKPDDSFEQAFLKEYNDALWKNENENRQQYPSDLFRPSSVGACMRNMFFMRKGLQEDLPDFNDEWTYNIIGITDNGTDRHERIQRTVAKMKNLKTLDVEEIVKEANQKGINTIFKGWNEDRTEARCVNYDLRISFQCDGVFIFNGKECLLEIKTASMFKYKKLTEPLMEHQIQATCYGMGLGIDYILFFYEDRNFLQHKPFLWKIPQELKDYVTSRTEKAEWFVQNDVVPPAERDKCMYCKHKTKCEAFADEGMMLYE